MWGIVYVCRMEIICICWNTPKVLNIAGLIVNIIGTGAVVLYSFPIKRSPPDITQAKITLGGNNIEQPYTHEERVLMASREKWVWKGAAVIGVGFILQLVAAFLS